MFNAFSAEKKTSAKPLTEEQKKKLKIKEKRHRSKTKSMANQALQRREEWIMDASHSNNFNSNFFNGSIPLINSKHHTFRDLDQKDKGFSPFHNQYASVSHKYSFDSRPFCC